MVDTLTETSRNINYIPTTGGIRRFYWNSETTAGLPQKRYFSHGLYCLSALEVSLAFKNEPITFPTGSQKLIGAIERPGKDFAVIFEEDGEEKRATYLLNRVRQIITTYELIADCTCYAPDAIITIIN